MVTGEGTVHLKSLFVDVRGALVDLEGSQLSAILSLPSTLLPRK